MLNLTSRFKELEKYLKTIESCTKRNNGSVLEVRTGIEKVETKIDKVINGITEANNPSNRNNKPQSIDSTINIVTLEQVEKAVNSAISSVKSSKMLELRKTDIIKGTSSDITEDFAGEGGMKWIYLGQITKKSNSNSV